jgi:hypothetical protein
MDWVVDGLYSVEFAEGLVEDPAGNVNIESVFAVVSVDVDACGLAPCSKNAASCTDLPAPAPHSELGRTCGACMQGYAGNGSVCEDTDACAAFPCSAHAASCTDHAAPAPNSTLGRTCGNCVAGYEGDGDVCRRTLSPLLRTAWSGSFTVPTGKCDPAQCCCLVDTVVVSVDSENEFRVNGKVDGAGCAGPLVVANALAILNSSNEVLSFSSSAEGGVVFRCFLAQTGDETTFMSCSTSLECHASLRKAAGSDQAPDGSDTDSSSNIYVVVGVILGTVFGAILIGAILFFSYSRSRVSVLCFSLGAQVAAASHSLFWCLDHLCSACNPTSHETTWVLQMPLL